MGSRRGSDSTPQQRKDRGRPVVALTLPDAAIREAERLIKAGVGLSKSGLVRALLLYCGQHPEIWEGVRALAEEPKTKPDAPDE
jgi:hypothetical protein